MPPRLQAVRSRAPCGAARRRCGRCSGRWRARARPRAHRSGGPWRRPRRRAGEAAREVPAACPRHLERPAMVRDLERAEDAELQRVQVNGQAASFSACLKPGTRAIKRRSSTLPHARAGRSGRGRWNEGHPWGSVDSSWRHCCCRSLRRRAMRRLRPTRAVIDRPRSWSACPTAVSVGGCRRGSSGDARHDAARARPRARPATRPHR